MQAKPDQYSQRLSLKSWFPGGRWLAGTVVGLWFLAGSVEVLACRCAQQSLEAYFSHADTVARVKVVGVTATAESRRARLEILRLFKGQPETGLSTATSSASCGLNLYVGQELWLFGTVDDSGVSANYCDGTRPVDQDFQNTPAEDVEVMLSGIAGES